MWWAKGLRETIVFSLGNLTTTQSHNNLTAKIMRKKLVEQIFD
jgi:hypothetical protein